MGFTDFRLKFRRFIRNYSKLLSIVIIVWGLIFLINIYLKNRPVNEEPQTTYELHTSVMDSTVSTPKTMQKPIEDYIEEYVGYCNEGNYQKAFNMLSEECRKYEYKDDVKAFMDHVLVKMPTPKKYSIQDYSNTKYGNKRIYIYEIKYIDDLMATGLTNSTYNFTSEKLTFYEDEKGNLQMNVGNYIYHSDIKSISENEYLKIDVLDKIVNYSIETYQVKFTNRSNYTIVLADGNEADELILQIPQEIRNCTNLTDLVLKPKETITLNLVFPKFIDDGDVSQALIFSSIRVMEKYSGPDAGKEVVQSEMDNAISKFKMEVKVSE